MPMYRVLIIEDEPAYLAILAESFTKEDFDVVVAKDVKEGILEVVKGHFDVILLDIMLPGGMNGFDFLERLKASKSTKDIPVIVITNLPTEEKVAKKIGAACYLVKSETTIEQIMLKTKELIFQNLLK